MVCCGLGRCTRLQSGVKHWYIFFVPVVNSFHQARTIDDIAIVTVFWHFHVRPAYQLFCLQQSCQLPCAVQPLTSARHLNLGSCDRTKFHPRGYVFKNLKLKTEPTQGVSLPYMGKHIWCIIYESPYVGDLDSKQHPLGVTGTGNCCAYGTGAATYRWFELQVR